MRQEGCGKPLAAGQWWTTCGETDMGQTVPVLCTECGGEYRLREPGVAVVNTHVQEIEIGAPMPNPVVVVGLPSCGNRIVMMGLLAAGASAEYIHADTERTISDLDIWLGAHGGKMVVMRRSTGWLESFKHNGFMDRVGTRGLISYVGDWEQAVREASRDYVFEMYDLTYERILADPAGELDALQDWLQDWVGVPRTPWPFEIKEQTRG